MNVRREIIRPIVLAALGLVVASGSAMAQGSANIFSQNRDQPMHIEAAKLEVRDKERVATFTGNVQVVQGDMTVRCATMVVYYEEGKSPAPAKKSPAQQQQGTGGGGQQISRLEAKGNVVVVQRDQTATGDSATFDVRSNILTMRGNVVINKGLDVTRGDVVVVDLTTGVSTVNTAGKGPVQVLINSSGSKPAPTTPMRPASR
jgi:lipopolysaccharide export system protein LptA